MGDELSEIGLEKHGTRVPIAGVGLPLSDPPIPVQAPDSALYQTGGGVKHWGRGGKGEVSACLCQGIREFIACVVPVTWDPLNGDG